MKAHINGTELFYTTHGRGRPMLVMHGGLGWDHTYFRPWLDALADRVELIYYDHRGNGRSARPAGWDGLDHTTWADDADALRAFLGHETVILFGHSYGGFLAQEYALRYGDRLDGLILCDTAPALDYPDVTTANAQRRGTHEQVQVLQKAFSEPVESDAALQEITEVVLPLYFHRNASERPDIMAATVYSAAAFNHGFFRCMPTFNTLDRLHEITAPTLVLAGRDDWIGPPEQGAERLHAALPRSELFIFEHSGHFPFIEEQQQFAAVVSEWMARLD